MAANTSQVVKTDLKQNFSVWGKEYHVDMDSVNVMNTTAFESNNPLMCYYVCRRLILHTPLNYVQTDTMWHVGDSYNILEDYTQWKNALCH